MVDKDDRDGCAPDSQQGTVPSYEELMDIICEASRQGMLGLFLGSGFSKAVVGDNALSWKELLEKSVEQLTKAYSDAHIPLDMDPHVCESGNTYPVVASKVERSTRMALSEFNACDTNLDGNADIDPKALDFRETIAGLVSVYPTDEQEHVWKACLQNLELRWVVTTNYDHIIECLLGGCALPLYPDQVFTSPRGLIPVFHLHGSIWDPHNIVITNEDYARMLRPGDYRQTRLPSLLKEATVLMAGYEMGDLNVLSAVDWCNTVDVSPVMGYRQRIIFIRYVGTDGADSSQKPYVDPDTGILVAETSDLHAFFHEIGARKAEVSKRDQQDKAEADRLMDKFAKAELTRRIIKEDDVDRLSADARSVQALSSRFPYLVSAFLIYLKLVIARIDRQSRIYGAFEEYDRKLRVLLMLMNLVDEMQMPDEYMAFLCNSLNEVSRYFGAKPGDAFAATKTWRAHRNEISTGLLGRMKRYCNNEGNGLPYARRCLDEIEVPGDATAA